MSTEVETALDTDRARRRKRPARSPALYCANAERAVAMAKRGFRFLAVGSDLGFLRDGIGGAAEDAEGLTLAATLSSTAATSSSTSAA